MRIWIPLENVLCRFRVLTKEWRFAFFFNTRSNPFISTASYQGSFPYEQACFLPVLSFARFLHFWLSVHPHTTNQACEASCSDFWRTMAGMARFCRMPFFLNATEMSLLELRLLFLKFSSTFPANGIKEDWLSLDVGPGVCTLSTMFRISGQCPSGTSTLSLSVCANTSSLHSIRTHT